MSDFHEPNMSSRKKNQQVFVGNCSLPDLVSSGKKKQFLVLAMRYLITFYFFSYICFLLISFFLILFYLLVFLVLHTSVGGAVECGGLVLVWV